MDEKQASSTEVKTTGSPKESKSYAIRHTYQLFTRESEGKHTWWEAKAFELERINPSCRRAVDSAVHRQDRWRQEAPMFFRGDIFVGLFRKADENGRTQTAL